MQSLVGVFLTIFAGFVIYQLSYEKIINVLKRTDPTLTVQEQESLSHQYVNLTNLKGFDVAIVFHDITKTINSFEELQRVLHINATYSQVWFKINNGELNVTLPPPTKLDFYECNPKTFSDPPAITKLKGLIYVCLNYS
jgi:hypothetical protein